MGRSHCPGNWDKHASDWQYREKSKNLDSSYPGFYDTGPIATCIFKMQMNGTPVSSGMGTCGFVGQIGVYTGWASDVAGGTKTAITGFDWLGMILICFVLPAVLSVIFWGILRKIGWIKENDLKL